MEENLVLSKKLVAYLKRVKGSGLNLSSVGLLADIEAGKFSEAKPEWIEIDPVKTPKSELLHKRVQLRGVNTLVTDVRDTPNKKSAREIDTFDPETDELGITSYFYEGNKATLFVLTTKPEILSHKV